MPKMSRRKTVIIIGNELIDFDPIFSIDSKNDIEDVKKQWQNMSELEVAKSPINLPLQGTRLPAMVSFKFDKELIKSVKNAGLRMAISCQNRAEALLANAAGANIIIAEPVMAAAFSKLAEYYLFDAKIACIIEREADLEPMAKAGVDAVIFKNAIKFKE